METIRVVTCAICFCFSGTKDVVSDCNCVKTVCPRQKIAASAKNDGGGILPGNGIPDGGIPSAGADGGL